MNEAKRRRGYAIALLAAFCLHNAEEAVTFASYRAESAKLIAGVLGKPIDMPRVADFHLALLAVTILAAALLLFAATGQSTRMKWGIINWSAAIMLINVFLPHIPAAIAFGGYAPGVVTAMCVNLPLAVVVLRYRP